MTTISLGAKKFGTDLGMKAPAKRSTKHKVSSINSIYPLVSDSRTL